MGFAYKVPSDTSSARKTLCFFACTGNKSKQTVIKLTFSFSWELPFSPQLNSWAFRESRRICISASFRLIWATVQLYNIIVNSIVFQVLKEALRMFPPVPVHFREAIKEIDLGHGHIIPAGTNIFMSVYTVHRDPRHFPDPEKFYPDRFSPQNSVGRHPYAYTPFGIGRRMCVGHVFATMEAKTILSTVLRRYRVTEIEGGIKGLEESLKMYFVMTPANGIRVKLLPRSHPSHIRVT